MDQTLQPWRSGLQWGQLKEDKDEKGRCANLSLVIFFSTQETCENTVIVQGQYKRRQ